MIKTPRGTRDFFDEKGRKMKYIMSVIENVFIQFNGTILDTPVFELTSILMNKYGDEMDNMLMYNIGNPPDANAKTEDDPEDDPKDDPKKGSLYKKMPKEKISLRYDLTVPLIRFLVQNGIKKMKRYQIGKVYRKDTPNESRLRFREFYQADFDIVGIYNKFIPEATIFKIINTVFKKFNITNYTIKYNFRDNLKDMVDKSGITSVRHSAGLQERATPGITDYTMFKYICSQIDKLDKSSWVDVKADIMKNTTIQENQLDTLKQLLDDNYFSDRLVDDHNLLLKYFKLYNVTNCKFDSKLARGLDYYTGIIYEIVINNPNTDSTDNADSISIAGGGRYDKLMESFGSVSVPIIGISFGINRMEHFVNYKDESKSTIFIASFERGFLDDKLILANLLIDNGFRIDYFDSCKTFKDEFTYARNNGFEFMVAIGGEEYSNDPRQYVVKNLFTRKQQVLEQWELLEFLKAS
jgi:histidyl-tRNA synthetase